MHFERVKSVLKATLPAVVVSWLGRQRLRFRLRPPLRRVGFGDLRRLTPISTVFGLDRGLCIDRYYIEHFLSACAPDVRGHVLEIGDDTYARKFGGELVTGVDVLHATSGNPKATIVADLAGAERVPSDAFDCIICTQTLQFVYDVRAAAFTLYRLLKPGGVLLATFPGLSQISRYDMERWGEYWRFTNLSAQKLFHQFFPTTSVTVLTYGNVFTAICFLHGLASEELRREELDYRDPDYEVIIAVRAVKPRAT